MLSLFSKNSTTAGDNHRATLLVMPQRPNSTRHPGHRQALATLVALTVLVVAGCSSESDDDTGTAPAVTTEAEAPPEADPAPVYDEDRIRELIAQVPPAEDWESIANHIVDINAMASMGPGIPLEAELSPTVDPENAAITIDAYSKAMGMWSFFDVVEVPIVWSIMSEGDYDWWYQRVSDIETPRPALDVWNPETNLMGHCYPDAYSYCGYGNPTESGVMFQYLIIGSKYEGAPNRNTVHHEAAHYYQSAIPGHLDAERILPCWFIEGQASFIGNSIAATYNPGAPLSRFQRSLPGDASWSIEEWESLLADLTYDETAKSECRQTEINYTLGAAIFEYLYGNYSMLDIHKLYLEAIRTMDWSAATTAVVGLSADELNAELALYVHALLQGN